MLVPTSNRELWLVGSGERGCVAMFVIQKTRRPQESSWLALGFPFCIFYPLIHSQSIC